MAKDHHRKHQQLMQELTILNARIRGHEMHMRKVQGKISGHEWEDLVRGLKKLSEKKETLNRKIRELR